MDRIMILIVIGLLVFGCTGDTAPPGQPGAQENLSQHSGTQDTTEVNDTAAATPPGDVTRPQDVMPPTTGGTGSRTVLILGRSVAGAWMEYLGADYVCDDEACDTGTYQVDHGGYTFIYAELDTPPDIDDSALRAVDRYGQDANTVFFKLCFADFESDPYGGNLADNKGYVQNVYGGIVTQRHKKLIVGNALPMVAEYTDNDLVSNHRAYNQWLTSFAASHVDIEVLDLYGMLSDSSGNLKSQYPLDAYDSHLNDAAYAKITPGFMELLD